MENILGLIRRKCQEYCLDSCGPDCPLYKIRNIKYGIFIVDVDKKEYDIFGEINYTEKYIALHVNPNTECDYYVKLTDLVDPKEECVWSNDYVDLGTGLGYSGKIMTALMSNSEAASFVTKLGGFIGSAYELDFIYNKNNSDRIYKILKNLGYNPTYRERDTWTSSQRSDRAVWIWDNGGYWGYYSKPSSNFVVPLFESLNFDYFRKA